MMKVPTSKDSLQQKTLLRRGFCKLLTLSIVTTCATYKVMEKKFIQIILFSTTILVVYALVSPPLQLSAQGAQAFNEAVRLRKGIVTKLDSDGKQFIVDFEGASLPVFMNASTTITAPNGSETDLKSLREGSSIYVFGNYDKESHSITAEKIVMRNQSVLERKSLSRADMRAINKMGGDAKSTSLEELSLQPK